MKKECPICGIEGVVQIRGRSVRFQHYRGYANGKRLYEYHKIPSDQLDSFLEGNGSKNL